MQADHTPEIPILGPDVGTAIPSMIAPFLWLQTLWTMPTLNPAWLRRKWVCGPWALGASPLQRQTLQWLGRGATRTHMWWLVTRCMRCILQTSRVVHTLSGEIPAAPVPAGIWRHTARRYKNSRLLMLSQCCCGCVAADLATTKLQTTLCPKFIAEYFLADAAARQSGA